MTKADAETFLDRLAGLSEYFNVTLSPAVQQVWFHALKDLELVPVIEAMNSTVASAIFMPKVADIRQLVCGDNEDQAERAWLAFKEAAKVAGGYSSLLLDDAVLAETIVGVFGGWVQACRAELSQEMWASKRKEFGRVYRVFSTRGLRGSRYLAGEVESQNAISGRIFRHPLALIAAGAVKPLSGDEIERAKQLAASEQHTPDCIRELSA